MVASKPKKSAVPDSGPKTLRTFGKGARGVHAPLAKGGATSMAGRGDRTTTAPEDSAGEQRPGSTAHKTSSRGSLLAEGGSQRMLKRQAADPAAGGHTSKTKSAASPKQASGGISRSARPGQCGT